MGLLDKQPKTRKAMSLAKWQDEGVQDRCPDIEQASGACAAVCLTEIKVDLEVVMKAQVVTERNSDQEPKVLMMGGPIAPSLSLQPEGRSMIAAAWTQDPP